MVLAYPTALLVAQLFGFRFNLFLQDQHQHSYWKWSYVGKLDCADIQEWKTILWNCLDQLKHLKFLSSWVRERRSIQWSPKTGVRSISSELQWDLKPIVEYVISSAVVRGFESLTSRSDFGGHGSLVLFLRQCSPKVDSNWILILLHHALCEIAILCSRDFRIVCSYCQSMS